MASLVPNSIHAGGAEDAPIYARIGAALVTSAIGITVANPSDVVKVRQQACSIRADAHGNYIGISQAAAVLSHRSRLNFSYSRRTARESR